MAKKKKNTNGQRFFPLPVLVLIGVCFGLMVPPALERCTATAETLGAMLISYLIFLIGASASIIFHTVVHEGGHLVFGLLSGYRFRSFRVFNLMWIRQKGKLQLRRLSVAGTAGQCLMVPPELVDGKIPVVLYNMGGAILNGIFAVAFLGLFFLFEQFSVLSALMLIFSLTGCFFGITNAVPMMTAFIPNDGHNAVSLGKHPEAMRAFWIQLKIMEQTAQGVRLKDMPPEWFKVPADEDMQNVMISALGVFACNRLEDEDRLEDARVLMERLLAADICLIGLHRSLLMNELIFIETVGQNRQEVIRSLITRELMTFQKKMSTSPSILRTQYACALLVDKDCNKATKIKRNLEKAIKKYPYPCELEQEYEFLRRIESKVQLKSAALR